MTKTSKKIYVRMTDKLMSGWGESRNMINVYVIACDTWEQAEAIERAAHKRSEMKRIAVCLHKPANRPGVLYSHRDFADMGGPWLEFYRPAQVAA